MHHQKRLALRTGECITLLRVPRVFYRVDLIVLTLRKRYAWTSTIMGNDVRGVAPLGQKYVGGLVTSCLMSIKSVLVASSAIAERKAVVEDDTHQIRYSLPQRHCTLSNKARTLREKMLLSPTTKMRHISRRVVNILG